MKSLGGPPVMLLWNFRRNRGLVRRRRACPDRLGLAYSPRWKRTVKLMTEDSARTTGNNICRPKEDRKHASTTYQGGRLG